MPSSARNILFISHSAGRTGAPIMLLRFMEWLKSNTEIPFEVLSKADGVLRSDFETLAPTVVCRPPRITRGFTQKLSRCINIGLRRHYYKRMVKRYKTSPIRLVYSNTVTNAEILSGLANLNCPAICHVHELEYWINKNGITNFELLKRYSTHYIAASLAVKQNLVRRHGISEHKIDVVHEFIDCSTFTSVSANAPHVRNLLNVPEDAFIVGGSGFETWRKGKDLFVQLALLMSRKFNERPVHFLWLGGRNDGMDFYELQHDIEHAGLSGRVLFLAEVQNPAEYFEAFDVFAMLSREDPFPLVNLEVAALGKPIVCFDNAGGTPEFVEDDAGFVVPYLDIDAMADKMIALARNEGLRKRLGSKAAQKVRQRHDISIAAPKILQLINRFLSPAQSNEFY